MSRCSGGCWGGQRDFNRVKRGGACQVGGQYPLDTVHCANLQCSGGAGRCQQKAADVSASAEDLDVVCLAQIHKTGIGIQLGYL